MHGSWDVSFILRLREKSITKYLRSQYALSKQYLVVDKMFTKKVLIEF